MMFFLRFFACPYVIPTSKILSNLKDDDAIVGAGMQVVARFV
jgi:hypothetical protein